MLLYSSEHTRCFNYDSRKSPALEVAGFSKGEVVEKAIFGTSILFNLSGNYLLSTGGQLNKEVESGNMLLLPPGSHIHIEFTSDTTIAISREHEAVRLCECFPIEKLYVAHKTHLQGGVMPMTIHEEVREFLLNYMKHFQNGLRCVYYSSLKNKELFYLLRAYYNKEALAAFFAPLHSKDAVFSNFVLQNYGRANSVQQLAELSRYSISGFKKQFQKVFGTPASEWLRDRRAKDIFLELNFSELSIKELSYKFEFASVASFTAFCKTHFGSPPGEIRRKLHQEP